MCSGALASWREACHFDSGYQMLLSVFRCLCQRQPGSSVSAPAAAVFSEAFDNGTIFETFRREAQESQNTPVWPYVVPLTADAGTACDEESFQADATVHLTSRLMHLEVPEESLHSSMCC